MIKTVFGNDVIIKRKTEPMFGKQLSPRFVVPFFTVAMTLGRVEKFRIIDDIEADMANKSLTGSTVKASFYG